MSFWVDSHCHLDFPDFAEEGVQAVLERAKQNQVGAVLTISTHTQRYQTYIDLADQFKMVWTTIGVHPHQAAEPIETHITVERLVALANSHPKIVAIGECGLDYHYDFAPRDVQKRVFKTHIEAALETGLPIIIHAREADEDMISILNGYKGRNLRGVMHCFSSTQRLADTALELGFMLSFSGIVTFPKSNLLYEICRSIPLKSILIETDAPYLAPDPYRGKRNEPSFVINIGSFIAKLHKIDEIQLMNKINNNFFNLFNKIVR